MSGFYELEAGSTKSPTGYAYKEEGTWLAGRDYSDKERGERLMEAPDLKITQNEAGDIQYRRSNGQFAGKGEIESFKKAKNLDGYSRDSRGNWHGPDGKFVSGDEIYNKLKYSQDEKSKGITGHKRRQTNNWITGLMDQEGYTEAEARERVNEFKERRKKIQKKDIPKSERRDLIVQAQNDILYG